MRRRTVAATSVLALAFAALTSAPATAEPSTTSEQTFVVVFAEDASPADTRAAVKAAGGKIVSQNSDIGVATVETTSADFADAASNQAAIEGAARDRAIGQAPPQVRVDGAAAKKSDPADADLRNGKTSAPDHQGKQGGHQKGDPLSDRQWDMKQIGAPETYKKAKTKGVTVAILDTGVDGSHPDIAPNFNGELSRNFTTDIEADANGDPIDGACADESDGSCEDPADVDENGHGTHVASTIGSPLNGVGVAGVAPEVELVNLRAGQDSGYFFLQPSLDALTYAGNEGIDVVNMSYYVDPWLFNCASHPADSPEDQIEQQTIVTAMQRALDYARDSGVTLVAAAGNQAADYTKPYTDSSSPDFASEPGEAAYTRELDDPEDCVSMPSEGDGVISVSSTGPTERKAYYSSYGDGYVDIAAPGGDAYDTPDGTRDFGAIVLAAYPENMALEEGAIDENGDVVVDWAVKDCDKSGECSYYQYLQGTSMASPHAAGVAALAVGAHGHKDPLHGGKALDPSRVEQILTSSATAKDCPDPADFTYTRTLPNGTVVTSTHTCEDAVGNGFYGAGIISAPGVVAR